MQKSKTRSFLGRLLRGSAVLAMAAAVLPALGSVKAEAASYGLSIDGTTVTDENKSDIKGNGVFSYDPSTYTLTVSGNYTAQSNTLINNTGISGLVISVNRDSVLIGKSGYYALKLSANTKITGGRLHLGATYSAIYVNSGTLTIENADLNVASTEDDAIYSSSYSNKLNIINSKVSLQGSSSDYAVFGFGSGNVTLTDCFITEPYECTIESGSSKDSGGSRVREIKISQDFGLKIANTTVMPSNMDDVLGNGVFRYLPSCKTLIVAGDCILDSSDTSDRVIDSSVDGLTIDVQTASTLQTDDATVIRLTGDTTITGSGKLTVNTDNGGIGILIRSGKTLTLSDLIIHVEASSGYGICGMPEGEKLIVSHSGVSVTTSTGRAIADFNGGITLQDSVLNGSGYGINQTGGFIYYSSDTDNPSTNASIYAESIQHYDLYVSGVMVNARNRQDILGNGVFQFDPDTKSLYVMGDYVSMNDMISSSVNGLTISTSKNVTLETGRAANVLYLYNADALLIGSGKWTFRSASSAPIYFVDCELEIQNTRVDASSAYNICGIRGEYGTVRLNASEVTVSATSMAINCEDIILENCALVSPAGGSCVDGAVEDADGNFVSAAAFMPVYKYGVRVKGIEVTNLNCDDILGDGKLSYNKSDYVLVVNGSITAASGNLIESDHNLYLDVNDTAVLTSSNGNAIDVAGNLKISVADGKKLTVKAPNGTAISCVDFDVYPMSEGDWCELTVSGKNGIIGSGDDDADFEAYYTTVTVTATGTAAISGFPNGFGLEGCSITSGGSFQNGAVAGSDGTPSKSVTIKAPRRYQLYIAGKQVTENNQYDILENGSCVFTYIPASNLLVIDGNYTCSSGYLIQNYIPGLRIQVVSDSELTNNGSDMFYIGADTTISGSGGKLILNTGDDLAEVNYCTLTFDGIEVEATAYDDGFYGYNSDSKKARLVFKETKLQLTCGSGDYAASGFAGGIELINCRLASPVGAKVYTSSDGFSSFTDSDNYKISSVTINDSKALTNDMITLSKTEFPYKNGEEVKIGSYVTVKDGDTKLKYGTDFTLMYLNNKDLGIETALLRVIGMGAYEGSTGTIMYSIVPVQQAKPTLTYKDSKMTIAWTADANALGYHVQYCKNSSFTGSSLKELYLGKSKTSAEITTGIKTGEKWYVRVRAYIKDLDGGRHGIWSSAANITLADPISTVTLSKSTFPYTGNAVKVGSYITVKSGDTKLKYGDDFTLTYSENVECGISTAKVTVKGTGKYTGTITKKYTIVPAQQAKPTLTVKNGKLNAKWAADSKAQGYQVQYSKNSSFSSYKLLAYATKTTCELPEPALGEKWYVRVRSYIKGSDGKKYGIWSESSVKTLTLPIDSVTLSKSSFAYTGSQVKVGSYITVKSGDTKLKYGDDFTLTYSTNVECGVNTAKVTVKGTGKYSGTISKTYTIYPAQQAAPKLSTVSGKLHAAWTKDTKAQGYQVQYCQNKDFTGDTLHSSSFAATATNGDLKYGTSGSLWYVRVRAYITSSSGTKYGEWSSISSLKVGKLSTVTLSQSTFTYTGNPIKVGSYITVKSGNTKLKYGTDFTLSYKNNTAKGTATVIVTGIGEYSGTLSKTYTIK